MLSVFGIINRHRCHRERHLRVKKTDLTIFIGRSLNSVFSITVV